MSVWKTKYYDTSTAATASTYPYATWGTTGDGLASVTYDYYDERVREVIPERLPPGTEVKLPDGASLVIDHDGNYKIEDQLAQVIYKANRVRDFSPHLNASDMLADFVKYTASLGVKKEEVLNLPIHLFLSWLIIEAAERDGDPITEQRIEHSPEIKAIKHPKCLTCGKYIKRLYHENHFPYCNPSHALLKVQPSLA